MTDAALILPLSLLEGAEPALRRGVFELLGIDTAHNEAEHKVHGFGMLSTRLSPIELDVEEARLFLETCSPKTKKVLAAIIDRKGQFDSRELEESLGIGTLRGVWTGLTRRIRSLTGNDSASLFHWKYDESSYPYQGTMADYTVQAFKHCL